MGLDVEIFLDRAGKMVEACRTAELTKNPGARLAAAVVACAVSTRNKLTIVADDSVASFGLWVEQLVAESTGKEGKGIVPVAGERIESANVFGSDRVFVAIEMAGSEAVPLSALREIEAAGHPIIRRTLRDRYDLAEEFFLWEFATALIGHELEINPFDQPNVQESKDATKELLDRFQRDGMLEEQQPLMGDDGLQIYAEGEYANAITSDSLEETLCKHFAQIKPGDYFAILGYVEETSEISRALDQLRTEIRNSTHCAVTIGYGPRFLHSTGQLHKGGSDQGVFLQLTAADKIDYAVPGEPYSFGILKQAQALGDFRSLVSHGRRAIRVDLGHDTVRAMDQLIQIVHHCLSR
jgi:hypothetical protein